MPTIIGVAGPDAGSVEAAPGVYADFGAFFLSRSRTFFWAVYVLGFGLAIGDRPLCGCEWKSGVHTSETGRNDLSGLPAATVIPAQIAPLLSASIAFGEALLAARVAVELMNHDAELLAASGNRRSNRVVAPQDSAALSCHQAL